MVSAVSEIRILCIIIIALLCVVTTGLATGLYYLFSINSIREELLKEIKGLVVEGDDCHKICSDHVSNWMNEIRGEHSAFKKTLELELKAVKGFIKSEIIEKKKQQSFGQEGKANHPTKENSDSCTRKDTDGAKFALDENRVAGDSQEEGKEKEQSTDRDATNQSDAVKSDAVDFALLRLEPGFNIEMEEVQEDGKTALFPCVIADVNDGGGQGITYDVVKFESSIIIKDVKREQFRKYQIYPMGTQAFLSRKKHTKQSCINHKIPITIVDYHSVSPTSSRKESQLHGKYKFTYNGDPSGKIQEAQALRIHRVLEEQ